MSDVIDFNTKEHTSPDEDQDQVQQVNKLFDESKDNFSGLMLIGYAPDGQVKITLGGLSVQDMCYLLKVLEHTVNDVMYDHEE